jgi:hypothetical protein
MKMSCAGGAQKAHETRLILKREMIDINEAANGVFLPASSKYKIDDATSHANVHTTLYNKTVFERLSNAAPGMIRAELQKIANELSNGTFPY